MTSKLAWLAPLLCLLLRAPAHASTAYLAQTDASFTVQFVDDLGVPIPELKVDVTTMEVSHGIRRPRDASPSRSVTNRQGQLNLCPRAQQVGALLLSVQRGPRAGHLQLRHEIPWDGLPGNAIIRLRKPGAFAGMVGGPAPFNDVAIRFLPPDASFETSFIKSRIGPTIVGHPAADGTFSCEGITPGTYTVAVYRGIQEVRRSVTIRSGEVSAVVLLEPTGIGSWVFGVLKDSSGARLAGVPLRLSRSSKFPYNATNAVIPDQIRTDRGGRFRFGPVVDGHFYIRPASGTGPLDIPVAVSQETVGLLMVHGKDVEIDLTMPLVQRPVYVNLSLDGKVLQEGSGEIQSLSTGFRLPFMTDQAGLLHVVIPVCEPGPLAVSVTDGRGTVAAWQTIDVSADRIDLSTALSSVQLTLGEGTDFVPVIPGSYELFKCRDSAPAVSVAKASVHRSKDHPESLVRFVGLPKGRYVCVCQGGRSKTRRFDFTVDGANAIEWTLEDLEPCPLEIRVGDRVFDGRGARLARFGLAAAYGEHMPPGTYDALLGGDSFLAMGQVNLRRGAVAKVALERVRPGSATIASLDAEVPLPASLTLTHELGFRFHAQRPGLTPDNPNAPFQALGLPPGKYEVQSTGRILATFRLAEGKSVTVKL